MDIHLTPALVHFIEQRFATGRYESKSEVIREALRLLELHYAGGGLRTALPSLGEERAAAVPTRQSMPAPAIPAVDETSISGPIPEEMIRQAQPTQPAPRRPQPQPMPQAAVSAPQPQRTMITEPAQPVGDTTMQAILSRIEQRIDRNADQRPN